MQTIAKQNFKLTAVIFEKDDFAIFATSCGNKVKGSCLDTPKSLIGSDITFFGTWEEHKKYGQSFSFTGYDTASSDIFYFLTSVVKGVGVKLAKLIIDKFKDETANVLEKFPNKLLQVPGIKQKKLKTIIQSWGEYSHLKKIAELLAPHGISNSMINKIYEEWGDQSIKILSDSPYLLTKIKGIGFKKADEIARKLGESPDGRKRADACVQFCFEKYMIESGHSAISKEAIFNSFLYEIKADGIVYEPTIEDYEASLLRLVADGEIIEYANGMCTTAKFDKMERYVLDKMQEGARMVGPELVSGINKYIDTAEINLGERQKDAVKMANQNPRAFIVSGHAGSGKTAVSKYILKLFEEKYGHSEIMCCALSGVAANRVKNQSGYDAQTIHSTLGVTGNGFEYGENKPLPYRVVLLDESSMVDLTMFYYLLKAIDFNKTTLIMLGDPAQLSPVGVGNIFSDCINLSIVPSVMMDKIYRQNEKQAIPVVANEVRAGRVPEVKNIDYDDFFFIDYSIQDYWKKKNSLPQKDLDVLRKENTEKIVKAIIISAQRVSTKISSLETTAEKISYFQVLSPMKEGDLGVKRLNKEIQEAINPLKLGQGVIKILDKEFRENDKFIHLHNKKMKTLNINDYDAFTASKDTEIIGEAKIFNGQMGLIRRIDTEEDQMFVEYPLDKMVAIYSRKDLAEGIGDISYAISIHKSQGSEFKNVILPLSTAHYMMLNPKLLYTAMTRAKDKLVMIGDPAALNMACKNRAGTERITISKILHQSNAVFHSEDEDCTVQFSQKPN
jgi:exodeoxyribonuclease V alpha subunit